MDAVHKRPARVPPTQALTRKPPPAPSPLDVVTAALEGRLRNRHDPPGKSLGYLGRVGGGRLPSEANVYDEEREREVALSEKPEPEREVEERAKEIFAKKDELGQLQYEGKWISHAYKPSVERADKRRSAISSDATGPMELEATSSASTGRQQQRKDREGGMQRAKSAYLAGGSSQPLGLMQKDLAGRRRSQRLAAVASAAAAAGAASSGSGGLGSRGVLSSMDAAAAAAAAVAEMEEAKRSGVSVDQALAAIARENRLAEERYSGWEIEAAKLNDTRLIKGTGMRGVVVEKKKRASLWHSSRSNSTGVCVIC
jgi:hypothetical protein